MVYLYYKDCKLGELKYENEKYIYNSLSGESEALEKYVGLVSYNLTNSVNKESDELFPFFVTHFINEIEERPDILKKIGIKTKNCYEILEKLCKLKLYEFGFYVKNH